MPHVRFEILAEASGSAARRGLLRTRRGAIETPAFLPVAAPRLLAGLRPPELAGLGARALLVSAYFLAARPGASALADLAGIGGLLGWAGPSVVDSGSAQAFGLARAEADAGGEAWSDEARLLADRRTGMPRSTPRPVSVGDEGIVYASPVDGSRLTIGFRATLALQRAADAEIGLTPDCPVADDRRTSVEPAVRLTARWAEAAVDAREEDDPDLFAVVQGSGHREAREASARLAAGLPVEGFAVAGGYDSPSAPVAAVLGWVCPLLPPDRPRLARGVGGRNSILSAIAAGADLVDSAAPAVDALAGKLYLPYGDLDVTDENLRLSREPVDPTCDCLACGQGFSRGYLRHLFEADELLGYTLAVGHNLRQVFRQVEDARDSIASGSALA